MTPFDLYLAPTEVEYRRERLASVHGHRRWPRVHHRKARRRGAA